MNYDVLNQPYVSNRYCVSARNGMVSTGSALASAAGIEILRKGGNAVDAAVATAAALTVVEPTANGLGSDAFAIVWMKDHLYGLNGSGYSPYDISLKKVKKEHCEMPVYGWTPVTVPGAVKSWKNLIERFGALSLKEDLEPAIRYAEEGYPLSPLLAASWKNAVKKFHAQFDGKREFAEWFRVFSNDGAPYEFGDIVTLKDHAKTLRLIAASNTDAFYKGEIAQQMVRQSERDGGYFCLKDLQEYDTEWVEPICLNYRGVDVVELPPNGQGIVALMALNILKNFEFADRDSADTLHKQLEAIKIAFADAKHYVSDPKDMNISAEDLLKDAYGISRAREITDAAGIPLYSDPKSRGTVYLCTADREGNMVSYIQSNYMGFGSGIVLEGYGVALQNRGADFSLHEEDVNALAGHKKTYHTIIPGFLMQRGKAIGPFGVMGGYMQPQGHVQVVMNLVDFHLNPQMALDAPRWQWIKEREVLLEAAFPKDVVRELKAKGHDITIAENRGSFGRGQIIQRLENGVLIGGCESRTDSNIACF